jgi:Flp pilus assembly protein TadB
LSFDQIKWASFAHSAIYAALLASWAAAWQPGETVFGYAHGIGWFGMCALAIVGVRTRVIPLYVAVCVAVIGAVGPFVGSLAFIREQRARVQRSWP